MLVNRAIRPRLVRLERGGSSSGRAAARPISCAGIPAHQIEPLATRPHFKNLAALGHLLSFPLFPFLTPLCFRLFIQGRACFASRRTCQSKPSFSLLVLCNQNTQRAPSQPYLLSHARLTHSHPTLPPHNKRTTCLPKHPRLLLPPRPRLLRLSSSHPSPSRRSLARRPLSPPRRRPRSSRHPRSRVRLLPLPPSRRRRRRRPRRRLLSPSTAAFWATRPLA